MKNLLTSLNKPCYECGGKVHYAEGGAAGTHIMYNPETGEPVEVSPEEHDAYVEQGFLSEEQVQQMQQQMAMGGASNANFEPCPEGLIRVGLNCVEPTPINLNMSMQRDQGLNLGFGAAGTIGSGSRLNPVDINGNIGYILPGGGRLNLQGTYNFANKIPTANLTYNKEVFKTDENPNSGTNLEIGFTYGNREAGGQSQQNGSDLMQQNINSYFKKRSKQKRDMFKDATAPMNQDTDSYGLARKNMFVDYVRENNNDVDMQNALQSFNEAKAKIDVMGIEGAMAMQEQMNPGQQAMYGGHSNRFAPGGAAGAGTAYKQKFGMGNIKDVTPWIDSYSKELEANTFNKQAIGGLFGSAAKHRIDNKLNPQYKVKAKSKIQYDGWDDRQKHKQWKKDNPAGPGEYQPDVSQVNNQEITGPSFEQSDMSEYFTNPWVNNNNMNWKDNWQQEFGGVPEQYGGVVNPYNNFYDRGGNTGFPHPWHHNTNDNTADLASSFRTNTKPATWGASEPDATMDMSGMEKVGVDNNGNPLYLDPTTGETLDHYGNAYQGVSSAFNDSRGGMTQQEIDELEISEQELANDAAYYRANPTVAGAAEFFKANPKLKNSTGSSAAEQIKKAEKDAESKIDGSTETETTFKEGDTKRWDGEKWVTVKKETTDGTGEETNLNNTNNNTNNAFWNGVMNNTQLSTFDPKYRRNGMLKKAHMEFVTRGQAPWRDQSVDGNNAALESVLKDQNMTMEMYNNDPTKAALIDDMVKQGSVSQVDNFPQTNQDSGLSRRQYKNRAWDTDRSGSLDAFEKRDGRALRKEARQNYRGEQKQERRDNRNQRRIDRRFGAGYETASLQPEGYLRRPTSPDTPFPVEPINMPPAETREEIYGEQAMYGGAQHFSEQFPQAAMYPQQYHYGGAPFPEQFPQAAMYPHYAIGGAANQQACPKGMVPDGQGGCMIGRPNLGGTENLSELYNEALNNDIQSVFPNGQPSPAEERAYYGLMPNKRQMQAFGEIRFPRYDGPDVHDRRFWTMHDEQNDRYYGDNTVNYAKRQYPLDGLQSAIKERASEIEKQADARMFQENNPIGNLPTRPAAPIERYGGPQYAMGGQYELTQDEVTQLLASGGQIEYL